jgi:integrase
LGWRLSLPRPRGSPGTALIAPARWAADSGSASGRIRVWSSRPDRLFLMPPVGVGRRRRCPAFTGGRPARTKGLRYPADPPTVEEIVAVMRIAGDGVHGWRLRGLVVVLWRAGLRIDEALSLREADLDRRRGSLLVRRGKGGRRREVGLDDWGSQELEPWLVARVALPIGPLFCIINGRTRGRPRTTSGARAELRRVAARAGVRRRFAPHQLRHAHAVEMAREGVPLVVIRRQLGSQQPRDHLGLPAGHRQRRNHRNGPRPARPHDPGHHVAAELAVRDRLESGVCTAV